MGHQKYITQVIPKRKNIYEIKFAHMHMNLKTMNFTILLLDNTNSA